MGSLKLVRRLSMAALMVLAITGSAFAAEPTLIEKYEANYKYIETVAPTYGTTVDVIDIVGKSDSEKIGIYKNAIDSTMTRINSEISKEDADATLGLKTYGHKIGLIKSNYESKPSSFKNISTNTNEIAENKTTIDRETYQRVAADLAIREDVKANFNRLDQHEARMDSIEDDVEENAEAISIVGAFSNIPDPMEGKSSVGMGTSFVNGETGMAIGVGHNFILDDNGAYSLSVTVKGGMAGDSYAVGAGAGLNF